MNKHFLYSWLYHSDQEVFINLDNVAYLINKGPNCTGVVFNFGGEHDIAGLDIREKFVDIEKTIEKDTYSIAEAIEEGV